MKFLLKREHPIQLFYSAVLLNPHYLNKSNLKLNLQNHLNYQKNIIIF